MMQGHLYMTLLLGTVGIINKVTQCDKGVSQSFCRRDPFIGIQAKHPFQEVYKLSSISFLSQHIRPLQMRRQVHLECTIVIVSQLV